MSFSTELEEAADSGDSELLQNLEELFSGTMPDIATWVEGLRLYTISYYVMSYCSILYYTILCFTILYYTILCFTTLHYTILYYTILYYTLLYFTLLYIYVIRYHLVPHVFSLPSGASGGACAGAQWLRLCRRPGDAHALQLPEDRLPNHNEGEGGT